MRKDVLRMTPESISQYMANFQNTLPAEVLYNLWAQERERILAAGKRSRDPHVLSMLDGFDRAVDTIDQWVSKKPKQVVPAVFEETPQ